ncbi:MAG: hypothetical protein SV186_02550 [Candidatus Nanohaloarchaea archaeon]|nr:hypothetical protein [Candidatus Nanohaloarchaea archaeon]
MANKSGEWDADHGYSFNPEKERVPLPSDDTAGGEPMVRDTERSSTDRDIEESVRDVELIDRKVDAMRTEQGDDRDERVDITRSSERPQRGVSSSETEKNEEFRRRRIINRAVRKVKSHLRSKGYEDTFIEDNEDLIRRKVRDFLA